MERFPVERMILYGSKARRDSDKDSDIDLTIVLRGPVHWRDEKAIVEHLFDVGMDYDVIFAPFCY